MGTTTSAKRTYIDYGGEVQVGLAHGPATKGLVRVALNPGRGISRSGFVVYLTSVEATELARHLEAFAAEATR